MATDRTRPSETIAVLLIVLGAAAWLLTPLMLIVWKLDGARSSGHTLQIVTLLAGCGVGGLTAASALPSVGRLIVAGAAALATAAVFALPWLLGERGDHLGRGDELVVVAASAIAFAGALLGRYVPASVSRPLATGTVELAVLSIGIVVVCVLGRLDVAAIVPLALAVLAIAFVAGGAIAARLIPQVTGSEAALGWVVIGITSALFPLVSPPLYRLLPLFAIAAIVTVPFAAGLAASGAALGGRAHPDEPLPPARAVTPPSA